MATDHSHRWDEVHATLSRLEINSQNDAVTSRLQPPSTSPGSRSGTTSVTTPTRLSTTMSEFQLTDRGREIPQFRREFARDSRQSNRRGRG